MRQELLDLLVCPETKQKLRPADKDLLVRVNEGLSAGSLRARSGASLPALAEALVREDGKCLYPVLSGIPVLLLEERVDLP